MKRTMSVVIAAMVAAAWSGVLHAAEPAKEGSVQVDSQSAAPPPSSAPEVKPENLSPMHREIFEAVEKERARIEELNERFLRAVRLEEKIAIEQEIEAVKKAGMISILGIQLRFAQAEGNAGAAGRLEAAIEAIENPKRPQAAEPTLLEREGAAVK